jgi:DNA-binding response OmpR family regulator
MSRVTTILLVEDNAPLREMFRRKLAREGFRVELAIDGEAALRISDEIIPDLILLDMNLPGKNGWMIASEMKSNSSTESIPIIAITAHAMTGDRERALQAGCNDYVSKPIDFTILLQKISGLIRG